MNDKLTLISLIEMFLDVDDISGNDIDFDNIFKAPNNTLPNLFKIFREHLIVDEKLTQEIQQMIKEAGLNDSLINIITVFLKSKDEIEIFSSGYTYTGDELTDRDYRYWRIFSEDDNEEKIIISLHPGGNAFYIGTRIVAFRYKVNYEDFLEGIYAEQ